MKNFKIYLLLNAIVAVAILVGCQNQGSNQTNKTILSGKVSNTEADKVQFRISGKSGNNTHKIAIDTNGSFKGEIPIDRPSYLRVMIGKQYTNTFARPGDKVVMKLNADSFDESLTYDGSAKTINNYLAAKMLLSDTVNLEGRMKMRSLYGSDPKKFDKTIDSVQGIYLDHLKEKLSNADVAPFRKMEKVNIKAKYQGHRLRYPRLYPRLTQDSAKSIPDDIKNFQPDVPLNDPNMMRVPNYQRIARRMVFNAKTDYLKQHPDMKDTADGLVNRKVIDSMISNDTVKAQMAGMFLENLIDRKSLDALKPLHEYYQKVATNKAVEQRIDSLMTAKKNIAPGNRAPGFTYPSHDGDTVSLADLRGKYVYIDVWATWCGPCIREIPYLKKLHDSMHNKNIAFVSVSVDRAQDKQKWRSMVKNKSLKGYQLYANGEAFDSKIANDYMIGSIPRFILISPDGKIIDPNAERPSGDIKARLEKLLNEKKQQAT